MDEYTNDLIAYLMFGVVLGSILIVFLTILLGRTIDDADNFICKQTYGTNYTSNHNSNWDLEDGYVECVLKDKKGTNQPNPKRKGIYIANIE